MKENSNNTSVILGIISIVISLLAFTVSFGSYLNSKKQFLVANQGYLRVVPHFSLANTNYGKGLPEILKDSSNFNAFNVYFNLNNVGKIPLHYSCKKFKLFMNNKQLYDLSFDVESNGIIYPDQTLRVDIPTLTLDKDWSFYETLSFKSMKVTGSIYIEYNDVGYDNIKTFDRDIVFGIRDNAMMPSFSSFRDKF